MHLGNCAKVRCKSGTHINRLSRQWVTPRVESGGTPGVKDNWRSGSLYSDRLARYPFYFAALGALEFRLGITGTARERVQAALALARNTMEQGFLEQRVLACSSSKLIDKLELNSGKLRDSWYEAGADEQPNH